MTAGAAAAQGSPGAASPASAERRFFERRRAAREIALDSGAPQRETRWQRSMEVLITGGILMLMALSTANSIYGAGWVAEMPDLRAAAAAAVIAGALGRIRRLRWPAGILLGLAIGAVVVLAQAVQLESLGGQPLFWDRFSDLYYRFEDWFRQAFNAGITTDNLPFVVFADAGIWIAAFIGSYAVARWRTPWPAMVLLGAMIAVNISYLSDRQWNLSFGFFLTGAVLLLMRTALLRRMDRWRRDGAAFPEWISLSFLAATLISIIVILSFSRVVPRPDQSAALNDAWSALAAPFEGLSDDFRRIFSGIDSDRGAPVHSFDDFMVLQGDIDPGDAIVLRVASTEAGLLRGAAYDRYTGRGWVQTETDYGLVAEREPISGAAPDDAGGGAAGLPRTAYAARRPVAAQISVERSPDVLFTFGEPLLANKDVRVQALGPVAVELRFGGSDELYRGTDLEPMMRAINERLAEGEALSQSEIAGYVPSRYGIIEIEIDQESLAPSSITLRAEPEQAEVVGIRPGADRLRAGYTYQVTGEVSTASEQALAGAGANYPVWIRQRYAEGTAGIDEEDQDRLRQLLGAIAAQFDVPRDEAGRWNPYVLARAVETWLGGQPAVGADGRAIIDDDGNVRPLYPLTTDIELPPAGADVVSWFLFENVGEDGLPIGGYYDYHASAMAVLLQLADVPARIATGFSLNENNFDGRTANHLVRGQDAYTWVQVYFPGYGWVDFDPTPGFTADETLASIAGGGPRIASQRLSAPNIDLSPLAGGELPSVDLDDLLSLLATQPQLAANEAGGGISRWAWLGPAIALSALAGAGLLAAAAWRWSLRRLAPVERAWIASARLARWSGIGAGESVTPLEHAARIDAALGTEGAAAEVAGAFSAARYGRKRASEEQAAAIRGRWRMLRRRLLRRFFRLPGRKRVPERSGEPAPA